MNPWDSAQRWPCVCQGNDPVRHVHYAESPHKCARCGRCNEYRPNFPLSFGLAPEMTEKQACDLFLGPETTP